MLKFHHSLAIGVVEGRQRRRALGDSAPRCFFSRDTPLLSITGYSIENYCGLWSKSAVCSFFTADRSSRRSAGRSHSLGCLIIRRDFLRHNREGAKAAKKRQEHLFIFANLCVLRAFAVRRYSPPRCEEPQKGSKTKPNCFPSPGYSIENYAVYGQSRQSIVGCLQFFHCRLPTADYFHLCITPRHP